jgi:hypothetical protein
MKRILFYLTLLALIACKPESGSGVKAFRSSVGVWTIEANVGPKLSVASTTEITAYTVKAGQPSDTRCISRDTLNGKRTALQCAAPIVLEVVTSGEVHASVYGGQ